MLGELSRMGSLVSGLPEPSLFLPHLCLCLAQFSNQRRGDHSTGHVPFHSLLREWRCRPPSDRVSDPGVIFHSTLSNPIGLTFQLFPESDLPPLLCCQPHPSVHPHHLLRGPAGHSHLCPAQSPPVAPTCLQESQVLPISRDPAGWAALLPALPPCLLAMLTFTVS